MTLSQRSKPIMIVFFVFCAGIVLFNLVKQSLMTYFLSHYEPPPVTVSSVMVKEKTWQPYLEAVGHFVATKGVEVNAQTSGNVTKVHFESGQYIEKDQPLIDLDDTVEQSMLQFNEAAYQLKKINYERLNALSKKNATSLSSLDEARASLKQAEANVEKIKAEIRHKHITAPFSGELGIRKVNLGQYVTTGQTPIVTLQSLNPLYLNFFIPEQYYKLLYLGQTVLVKLQEYPEIKFVSKITAINPKADPNTHNIEVQATMPNCLNEQIKSAISAKQSMIDCGSQKHASLSKQLAILPGMFAAIAITLTPENNKLVVPSTAISYSLYGNAVYLIKPIKTQKTESPLYEVSRVFVKTGDQQGNETVILSGLKKGDNIVSAGELKLQNGTHVLINNDIKLEDQPNFENMEQ